MLKSLPETGFIRARDLIGTSDAPGLIPFGKTLLWNSVRRGTFPAPVRLGAKTSAWRVEDVRAWIAARNAEAPGKDQS